MDGFDADLLGDAAAQGDGRIRAAVADKKRSPEDRPAVELEDVALMESQGHEPAADALATGKIDDPQRPAGTGVKKGHARPAVRLMYVNQAGFSSRTINSY
jgi:hypothetical protein